MANKSTHCHVWVAIWLSFVYKCTPFQLNHLSSFSMQPPTPNFWCLSCEHPWVLAQNNTVHPSWMHQICMHLLLMYMVTFCLAHAVTMLNLLKHTQPFSAHTMMALHLLYLHDFNISPSYALTQIKSCSLVLLIPPRICEYRHICVSIAQDDYIQSSNEDTICPVSTFHEF